MGRGDVTIVHTIGGHELSMMLRPSLRGGDRSHGAVGFDWGFPIHNSLRGHVQVFDGYGESLIDYNHRSTYVGLGVSLLEWFRKLRPLRERCSVFDHHRDPPDPRLPFARPGLVHSLPGRLHRHGPRPDPPTHDTPRLG